MPRAPLYQFGCPGCGCSLQASLDLDLTSVLCSECGETFDVQLPNKGSAPIKKPAFEQAGGPFARNHPAPCHRSAAPLAAALAPAGKLPTHPTHAVADLGLPTDSSTSPEDTGERSSYSGLEPSSSTNETREPTRDDLESSLLSCTEHHARVLQTLNMINAWRNLRKHPRAPQMLQADPSNRSLCELRDQLASAIIQLRDTYSMVKEASSQGGIRKMHSSRKNKPQRCSACGGIGHKSRTCTRAAQQDGIGDEAASETTATTKNGSCAPTYSDDISDTLDA